MAGKGGRRAGAGAPTAAAKEAKGAAAKSASARFQERAAKDFDRIYDALADLAFGVFVEESGLTGKKRVYQRPPDRGALQTMMEHLAGKAAVKPSITPDTAITFLAAHVPRPKRLLEEGDGTDPRDEAAGEADQGAGGPGALGPGALARGGAGRDGG